jgi:hypothetical protein
MLWELWLPTDHRLRIRGFSQPWPSLAILGHPSQTHSFTPYPGQVARVQSKVVEMQLLDVRVTKDGLEAFGYPTPHESDNSFEENSNQVLGHASSMLTETRDTAATDTNHVASLSAKDYHPGSSYSPLGDFC